MSEQIKERIKIIIDHYGLTVSIFADNIGVQRSSISHILSGRNKPSLDFVMKVIQTYPSVNLYWLLNGKGHFPAKEESKENSPTPNPSMTTNTDSKNKIPKISPLKDNILEPVKIVMFYANGTFEAFEVKK
ncbi:hypothetical protein HME9304_03050 [Flagellimonas maritima]|uniref:HTH cro/C1-type domain-containing protein n=1 Tax=Flagellimonas maritima TaxID=1383885 RepID=A0A2Z4LXC3_9FLAO|nr:helix-turn-helix transcriptional regulator [Allomuricauda aurantiaca]AWX46018.1 hypothetical protein HME9304_03050 [Allomuricauda aurantiaca]